MPYSRSERQGARGESTCRRRAALEKKRNGLAVGAHWGIATRGLKAATTAAALNCFGSKPFDISLAWTYKPNFPSVNNTLYATQTAPASDARKERSMWAFALLAAALASVDRAALQGVTALGHFCEQIIGKENSSWRRHRNMAQPQLPSF
eukprot:6200831-Pleurochrysis_carterae.AAC.1